ncbi:hypothetical protein Tco_0173732 [Tanacetum coccineum]
MKEGLSSETKPRLDAQRPNSEEGNRQDEVIAPMLELRHKMSLAISFSYIDLFMVYQMDVKSASLCQIEDLPLLPTDFVEKPFVKDGDATEVDETSV